jgi:hypothetical protein
VSTERVAPPLTGGEREMLRSFLDYHRATLVMKCDGLGDEEDLPLVWSDEGDYQVAYDATGATRTEAFDAWQAEVEHSRRIERDAESLDVTGYNARWGEHVSLRLVMLHLIHEYARHNGHADLIREGIDGMVGA